ncbi:MFS transporter [Roseomonas sp. NAR14]|uniref:MFS transporter n=1 Tax=Roseomonas acroporae TaxID=2937791 RepID=A0A9X2BVP2_9PROT|nr:MFS transporter [Roseomonas acroporae]MCK8785261.1 MFS transporter [Roseomonas acroporae]
MRLPTRFALLYAALFGAVGVAQPFLPAYLAALGVTAQGIAALLAAASAVRLLAGPLAGRVADATGDPRGVLLASAAIATLTATAYGLAAGFWALLAVAVLHGIVSAPLIPMSDMLTLRVARREGFDYGRVRAAGSVAFILCTVAAGWAVQLAGIGIVVWLIAGGMALVALCALLLPRERVEARSGRAGFAAVLRLPGFRRLLLLSALIQGSHALYYGFGALHWQSLGLSPALIGLLWGEGVVLEVILFVFGAPLVARLGPRGLSLLAAAAGVLRWSITAVTGWLPALVLAQALHGLTFGAQHLAAMRLLAGGVPAPLAATAQTLHASLGVGLASGVLTLLCGPLYAWLGGGAFWAMAALCAAAVPAALGVRAGAAAGRPTP